MKKLLMGLLLVSFMVSAETKEKNAYLNISDIAIWRQLMG